MRHFQRSRGIGRFATPAFLSSVLVALFALLGGVTGRALHWSELGNGLVVELEDVSGDAAGFAYGTDPSGLNGGDLVGGVAWFDYNNDEHLDFYIANGATRADGLMRNNGDGTFTNVAASAGLDGTNGSSGVVAGDLNNDGFIDIVAVGEAGYSNVLPSTRAIRIFRNNGDGTFEDISDDVGIDIDRMTHPEDSDRTIPIPGSALHAALGDIDDDGYLDLFLAAPGNIEPVGSQPDNLLFRNRGRAAIRFENASAGSGVDVGTGACVGAFSHYDDDGRIDLFIADCNDKAGSPGDIHLLKNNGDFTFSDETSSVGLDTTSGPGRARGYWMCLGLGDIDNDTDMDLFSTNAGLDGQNQRHGLFERNTDGTFSDIEAVSSLNEVAPQFGWGCSVVDFNNDGFEDFAFAGNAFPFFRENPGHLFVNLGDKTFARQSLGVDLTERMNSGMAAGDFDNDGFVDLVIAEGTPGDEAGPILLRNSANGNLWLQVRLVGKASNRDAVGARVELVLPGRRLVKEVRAGSSFLSQDSAWLNFGLGTWSRRTARVARLVITWPSGLVEEYPRLRPKRIYRITEGQGIEVVRFSS